VSITTKLAAPDDLVTSLIALDHTRARASLAEGADAVALTGDRLLTAHQELHRRAREGSLDGATMAAASILCRRLLLAGVVASSEPAGPPRTLAVVVTSPPGEEHLLGAEAVAVALRRSGWPIDVVCGDVTPADLGSHLARSGAGAVVVACAIPSGLPDVAAALDTAHAAKLPVVVTGAAFGGDDLRALRLGADAWAPDLHAVVAVVERWADDLPDPGPVSGTSPEYRALRAKRHSLVATVAHGQAEQPGGDRDRILGSLMAHLCAAVLVDDSRLLLDFLSVELAMARTVDPSNDELIGLIDALAGAIPPALARSTALIDDGRRHLRLALGRSPRTTVRDEAPVSAPVQAGRAAPEASGAQVFADLLLLGAMACQAPLALISVPRPGGRWSTLSFGSEGRTSLDDSALLEYVGARREPVEIPDIGTHSRLARSSLSADPLGVRWVYGVPVRSGSEALVAVFCVLDRCSRQVSRREQRAILAVARQLENHLEQLHRTPAACRPVLVPVPAAPREEPAAPAPVERLVARRTALPAAEALMRSHEVAALFDVTERTVINWAAAAKLPALRTIGGHLRFRHEDVSALLADRRTGVARSG